MEPLLPTPKVEAPLDPNFRPAALALRPSAKKCPRAKGLHF